MKLFELYADLSLNSKGFESGVKKASKQGGNLANVLKNSVGGAAAYVGNKVSATTVMLGNLMADAVKSGTNMGKQLAKAGLQYNAQMETYVTNFRTMLGGSAEEAERLTDDLEAMAASTPFAMTDLADATQTLLQFGEESSSVLDTLKTLGDISMGDANKLQSLTLAFAQASSSGKLMGQDLMQMINAGFNPLQTIVDKTGESMGDLKEFMSSGKASTELKKAMRAAKKEVRDLGDEASEGAKMLVQMQKDGAISAELLGEIFAIETSPGGKFYQAMQAASKTFNGLMSTLEDDSTALLGKVFKPLSNWMTDELLPKGIDTIGKLSKAYDVGGWSEMVKVGTGVIKTELNRIGPIAVDAGAGLLANFYAGLSGNETSADDVKEFFSGLIDDAVVAKDKGIGLASDFLDGLAEGLTGQGNSSKEDIVSTIGGLFSGGLQDIQELTEAGTGLLGTLYSEISGQEATANNIGETIGGIFKSGTTAANNVLDTATSFFSDLSERLGDPDATTMGKISGVFFDGATAANNLLDDAGTFVGDLYGALTRDEASAIKIKTFFNELFATPIEWKERLDTIKELPEYAEQRREEITTTRNAGDVLKMLSSLVAGGHITESVFDEWSPVITNAVTSGQQSENYAEIANMIIEAYNSSQEAARQTSETQREAQSNENLNSTVIAAATAAASAQPAPIIHNHIYLDGQEIANYVEPAVSRKMNRKIQQLKSVAFGP